MTDDSSEAGASSDGSHSAAADPAVGDHLAVAPDAADPPVPAGVYRVVGTAGGDESADHVTLLRVADADRRRRHTGDLYHVSRDDLAALEPAGNPDGNRSALAAVADRAAAFWWELRVLAGAVRERPLVGGLLLVVIAIGYVGDRVTPIPDLVEFALVILGVAGLVLLARS